MTLLPPPKLSLHIYGTLNPFLQKPLVPQFKIFKSNSIQIWSRNHVSAPNHFQTSPKCLAFWQTHFWVTTHHHSKPHDQPSCLRPQSISSNSWQAYCSTLNKIQLTEFFSRQGPAMPCTPHLPLPHGDVACFQCRSFPWPIASLSTPVSWLLAGAATPG